MEVSQSGGQTKMVCMWVLQSPAGETTPFTFRMSAGTIKTVGRATGADFIVDAPLVSRLHCQLEAAADVVNVVDLKSTNGTYVNGERVERATLKSGDRLRVGRVELTATLDAQNP